MTKRTVLNDTHRALGAKMVDFGGWDMPISYGSQIEEHHAVRRDAGMFDVSHMTILDLHGENTRPFLRRLVANSVDKLKVPGKALYACMLDANGGVIDDLISYYLADDFFRLVVNAATRDKDLAWISAQAAPFGVSISARRDLAIVAVQGPAARERVMGLLPEAGAAVAGKLGKFTAAEIDGLFVARTGYTGEDGFEVMVPEARDEQAVDVGGGDLAELAGHGGARLRQQRHHALARGRTLHRDDRQIAALADRHAERRRLRADPRQVLVARGRVHDQPEEVLGEEIDDQVVDDAAVRVEHAGVERLARHLQLVDGIGDQRSQERPHVLAVQVEDGHVRHVEHARVAADRVVLLDLRAVADRHVPTAEVDHLRAERAVGVVEDRLLRHRREPVRERRRLSLTRPGRRAPARQPRLHRCCFTSHHTGNSPTATSHSAGHAACSHRPSVVWL